MRRTIGYGLTSLLFLAAGSLPTFAQQFSAILVHLKPEGAVSSNVSVRGEKIRFETQAPRKGGIAVLDLRQQTGFIALPEGNTYTVLPQGRIPAPLPFFLTTDSENACPAWEKLVGKPGSCSKVGDVTLNQRPAVQYKGLAKNGDAGIVWVDRKLNFVVKWEGQRSAAELREIHEGPQPLALFEVPKGYDKVDPQAAHQESRTKPPKAKTDARKPQK